MSEPEATARQSTVKASSPCPRPTSRILHFAGWALFAAIAIFRLRECLETPSQSSDAFRNLGYSSHLNDVGFGLYQTIASDFTPEGWASKWPELTFPYPPLTLAFFGFFSYFHLGIAWVKFILTLIDASVAFLFWRNFSSLSGLLYFAAPINILWTSHEGQFESLQVLLIAGCALATKSRRWKLSGLLLALSLQVKLFGVLLLPWMIYELWSSSERVWKRISSGLRCLALGFLAGIVLFLPFYIRTPSLILIPFGHALNIEYNYFHWMSWLKSLGALKVLIGHCINSFSSLNSTETSKVLAYAFSASNLLGLHLAILSLITLCLLLAYIVMSIKRRRLCLAISVQPLASFWSLIKSLRLAHDWYAIVAPGFLFSLRSARLVHMLIVIHFLQSFIAFRYYNGTLGGSETVEFMRLMESCLGICNPQEIIAPS